MYIQKRNNAFYLKNSQWDKEAKRVKATSQYLGSDIVTATNTLRELSLDHMVDELQKKSLVTHLKKS